MNAKILGINRNLPDSTVQDISLQDTVNLRYLDGAWRPVGEKVAAFETEGGKVGSAAVIHVIDDDTINVLNVVQNGSACDFYRAGKKGEADQNVATVIMSTTDTVRYYTFGKTISLVNDTRKEMSYLVWQGDRYNWLPPIPDMVDVSFGTGSFRSRSVIPCVSGLSTTFTNLTEVAKYANSGLNKERYNNAKVGATDGYVFAMCAFELMDGTFVRHTSPVCLYGGRAKFLDTNYEVNDSSSAGGDILSVFIKNDGIIGAYIQGFLSYQFAFTLSNSLETRYSRVIKGVSIFMTQPTVINPSTFITNPNQSIDGSTNYNVKLAYDANEYPSKTFENATSFYRVMNIPFEDIRKYVGVNTDIITDFNNITSNTVLPVDDYTNHDMLPEKYFFYNSRIFLGDINTRLASSTFGVVTLSIDSVNINVDGLNKNPGINTNSYFLTYPDIRATKMIGTDGSALNLKAHPHHNFAFAYVGVNGEEQFAQFVVTTSYSTKRGTATYETKNRIQASEVGSLYAFPSKNSYRVGGGTVLGFTTNAIPISQGQFGNYPLFVFTSEGMYALGMGDTVLVNNIVPLNGLVCSNPKSITQLDRATVFAAEYGLVLLQGTDTIVISSALDEHAPNPVLDLDMFENVLKHPQVGGFAVPTLKSTTSFKEYLTEAEVAYDGFRKELIVTKAGEVYSYVYSLSSQVWSKRLGAYKSIVEKYPNAYGVAGDDALHLLNREVEPDYTNVFFLSRAIKIAGGFKRLRRMLLRAYLEVANYVADDIPKKDRTLFGAYLLVSLDGVKWKCCSFKEVFGKVRDMVYLSSHFSAQYFMLLGAGRLSPKSYITSVDVDAEQAMGNQLR